MKKRQRIMWSEELIAEEITKIANQFETPRMPTDSEAVEMFGTHGLSNAISKYGGYEHWAKKLGLEQKMSKTKTGLLGEKHIAEVLKDKGFSVIQTSVKHPYDLLIDKCVKIDVKTAYESFIEDYPIHAYRIKKREHTCDFYIFYEADTGKIYVVPAHKCFGQVQVEMGNDTKPYAKYLNAFDLIRKVKEMYQEL